MSHLPMIAALLLPGPNTSNATDPGWFSLTEIERIVYAFSSLRDDSDEDFDSGQSEPSVDVLGHFWAGSADGNAQLRPDTHAETNAIQLSGPATNGAFWSIGDVDLSMTASEPLIQSFTAGGSRMAFVMDVKSPSRLESFLQLTIEGSADSLAWARLRVGTDNTGPYIYNLQITDGEALVEEIRTLPEGKYTLEAGARAEVFDVMGLTTATSGFSVSFTPTASCNAADFTEPIGVLDFNDVVAFLEAFMLQDPKADLGLPPLQFDATDVIEFLVEFSAGCP
ncbi:MAG: GC-type dockerin domain-anchored protein [Phycisphaerales bacterium]